MRVRLEQLTNIFLKFVSCDTQGIKNNIYYIKLGTFLKNKNLFYKQVLVFYPLGFPFFKSNTTASSLSNKNLVSVVSV